MADHGDSLTDARARAKDGEQHVKQWLLDLSNAAIALFDRIDERGLQAEDAAVTGEMRRIVIDLDFGLREAVAQVLMERWKKEMRRG